jgi:hypothetical protein
VAGDVPNVLIPPKFESSSIGVPGSYKPEVGEVRGVHPETQGGLKILSINDAMIDA